MANLTHDQILSATSVKIVPCTRPWTTIEERSIEGDYDVCCFGETFLGRIGKESNDDILTLINCDMATSMRQSMAEGRLPAVCPPNCDIIRRRALFNHSDFYEYSARDYQTFGDQFRSNREKLISCISNKTVTLDTFPQKFKLLPSYTCNLKCPMCSVRNLPGPRIGRNYYNRLYKLMPYLEEVVVFGGEPFACKATRRIVFGAEIRRHPQIHFSTITNGTLLDAKVLDRLRDIRLGWISVSLDAARQRTYEQVRPGAPYSKTMANLERLVRARDAGEVRIRDITISFVIQRPNYTEISQFLEIANRLRVMPKFNLVGRSYELLDVMDEVKDCVKEAISKAREFEQKYAVDRLTKILKKLPDYHARLTRKRTLLKLAGALPGAKAVENWVRTNRIVKRGLTRLVWR